MSGAVAILVLERQLQSLACNVLGHPPGVCAWCAADSDWMAGPDQCLKPSDLGPAQSWSLSPIPPGGDAIVTACGGTQPAWA